VFGEELVNEWKDLVFADPHALGVLGMPLAPARVVSRVGLTDVVGGVATPGLTVHTPSAQVANHVGAQGIAA
jgi:hypothetical protein